MTLAVESQKSVDAYLAALRKQLRELMDEDANDIVAEIRMHILDKTSDNADPEGVAATLAALGAPAELAERFPLARVCAAQHFPLGGLEPGGSDRLLHLRHWLRPGRSAFHPRRAQGDRLPRHRDLRAIHRHELVTWFPIRRSSPRPTRTFGLLASAARPAGWAGTVLCHRTLRVVEPAQILASACLEIGGFQR
jgi:hypothetical protein